MDDIGRPPKMDARQHGAKACGGGAGAGIKRGDGGADSIPDTVHRYEQVIEDIPEADVFSAISRTSQIIVGASIVTICRCPPACAFRCGVKFLPCSVGLG